MRLGNLRELVTFSGLDDTIKNQDVTVVGGLENKNVLVQRLLNMKDFLDLDSHSCGSPKNERKNSWFPEMRLMHVSSN
jgi:hypothetical protein